MCWFFVQQESELQPNILTAVWIIATYVIDKEKISYQYSHFDQTRPFVLTSYL